MFHELRSEWSASRDEAGRRADTGVVRVSLIGAAPLIAMGFSQCLSGADPVFELRVAAAADGELRFGSAGGEVRVIDGVSQPGEAESRVGLLVKADPDSPVVVLVGGYGAGEVARFLRAGALACLPVDLPPRQLRGRLAAICRGESMAASSPAGSLPRAAVGRREAEVLNLLVSGIRSHEIATVLGMRASTVASHLQNIRGKLGARSTAELIAIAARLGLVA